MLDQALVVGNFIFGFYIGWNIINLSIRMIRIFQPNSSSPSMMRTYKGNETFALPPGVCWHSGRNTASRDSDSCSEAPHPDGGVPRQPVGHQNAQQTRWGPSPRHRIAGPPRYHAGTRQGIISLFNYYI